MNNLKIMNAFLTEILRPTVKSSETLKYRVAFMVNLYNSIGETSIDLSYLTKKRAVMKFVRSSDNTATQRTRLMHIIKTIDADPSKLIPSSIKDYYGNIAFNLKRKIKEDVENNVMTNAQKERYLPYVQLQKMLEEQVQKLFNDYQIPYDAIDKATIQKYSITNAGYTKNIFTFAKQLQDITLLACYIWQPPIRNNYSGLILTHKSIGLTNDKNWIQLKKRKDSKLSDMNLILNNFKNSKYMGKTTIKVMPKLADLMSIWISLLDLIYSDKVVKPFQYTINSRGKVQLIEYVQTTSRTIPRISEKLFGRPLTINDYRHIAESALQTSDEYKNMTLAERKAKHGEMLHSLEVAQTYMKHDR